jgi:hypothetical protein
MLGIVDQGYPQYWESENPFLSMLLFLGCKLNNMGHYKDGSKYCKTSSKVMKSN